MANLVVGSIMLYVLFTFLVISCYVSMVKEAWRNLIAYKPWIIKKDRAKKQLPFYKKAQIVCTAIIFFIPFLNCALFIIMMLLPEEIYSMIYDNLDKIYG